ncbi:MAG TPA: type I phosphomannose isomerase catalytic subunit [Verrucomicrobiae bacterium]|nr:type I phosphomannose isomerase catalytic subunit [Verrucomicrobiae bacterium]
MKSILYPIVFRPIFKERVWGGRELERLFNKQLPAAKLVGESWEISDRPGDESVIANGNFAGKTVRWLMENYSSEILGRARPADGNRFPILCKLLDARDKLSLQVHPPAAKAAELRGEPKTEMWYIADARPQSELFVGLKKGVTRNEFEEKIAAGSVAECFHRVPVQAGDAMFLPSGRVHAIGAGLVIFEIQQNSDTTYRVFDWNRVGLDGKPRELHVAQSLASIDFNDFEPTLVSAIYSGSEKVRSRPIVRDPLFNVDDVEIKNGSRTVLAENKLQIIAVVRGTVKIQSEDIVVALSAGQFCLVPAELEMTEVVAGVDTSLLRVESN